MKDNLYQLYMANTQDLRLVLSSQDKVTFNGSYFSDAEFFTEGKTYWIVDVEEDGFYVLGNQSIELFIFPDGLSSFTKSE